MIKDPIKRQKTDKVKAHFEQSKYYLANTSNILFRREIIQGLLGNTCFQSVLDVACGNAEISLPFLTETNRLTLLDISAGMLEAASGNIPEHLRSSVTLLLTDFMKADLPDRSYDLIICTGLLAHIDDPSAALEKISNLLLPGGSVVLQNTNAGHPYSHLLDLYRSLGTLISRKRYRYNKVSESIIVDLFAKNGLILEKKYSYLQTFLIMDRLLKPETRYRLIRNIFGAPESNRMRWLGNDGLYLFRRRM